MSEREHEARREELAAYLLGALEPGEAAALEQHLAGCERCREELAWLRPAVVALPESVERVEPPAELRARIMAEARTDAAGPAARRRRRIGGERRAFLRPAVALAAILVIAAGVAGYALRDGGSGPESSTVVAGRAPGPTVRMVRTGDSGTLHFAHLRQLPGDEVLQAWVQRGGTVESAKALFVPNRDGTATATIDHMDGVDAVMLTVEPRGGSAQPTSKPVFSMSVPQ